MVQKTNDIIAIHTYNVNKYCKIKIFLNFEMHVCNVNMYRLSGKFVY